MEGWLVDRKEQAARHFAAATVDGSLVRIDCYKDESRSRREHSFTVHTGSSNVALHPDGLAFSVTSGIDPQDRVIMELAAVSTAERDRWASVFQSVESGEKVIRVFSSDEAHFNSFAVRFSIALLFKLVTFLFLAHLHKQMLIRQFA